MSLLNQLVMPQRRWPPKHDFMGSITAIRLENTQKALNHPSQFYVDNGPEFYYTGAVSNGTPSNIDTRRSKMGTLDVSGAQNQRRPYRRLREDPRYDEIKRIIEDFPADKMEKLKDYIQRWLRSS